MGAGRLVTVGGRDRCGRVRRVTLARVRRWAGSGRRRVLVVLELHRYVYHVFAGSAPCGGRSDAQRRPAARRLAPGGEDDLGLLRGMRSAACIQIIPQTNRSWRTPLLRGADALVAAGIGTVRAALAVTFT
jgi:hypothetical protein